MQVHTTPRQRYRNLISWESELSVHVVVCKIVKTFCFVLASDKSLNKLLHISDATHFPCCPFTGVVEEKESNMGLIDWHLQ